ncbi:C39 family peptidase [Actinoallomurus purpureus]|uniref:C39 family peptidase n=1 Tax=Actinoallomurus purpureus TaxID=478114 RepID=UPI0020931332|nr:C39 family peptidase [Actinoallomurus purpureus]MCO6010096.1 C39 family peptidase [Actinoallomurus purpureus]
MQHNAGFAKARIVIRVKTSAKRAVKGGVYLQVPGKSDISSTVTCSGTLAKGANKQCSTTWLPANRVVQNGNGYIIIAGSKRPTMILRGMHANGKKQENSAKYCGPATVQAALWTIKGSAPSQNTLASTSNLQTNRYGFTFPSKLAGVLNKYKPGSIDKYHLYDFGPSGQSSELAFKQIHQSIANANPVVYLVDPSKLPWSSNPTGTNIRHYILLYGSAGYHTTSDTNLNGGYIVDHFSAWDPASGSNHNITVPQLIHASTASQYIDDDLVFAAR